MLARLHRRPGFHTSLLIVDNSTAPRDCCFDMHIHARHAVDPELNLIAKRLGSLTWHTDLDEDEKQGCADTQRNPDAPKRLVSPMPDYQTWAVRMYIGGAQRTLGLLKAIDLSPVFRFADMVKMHF